MSCMCLSVRRGLLISCNLTQGTDNSWYRSRFSPTVLWVDVFSTILLVNSDSSIMGNAVDVIEA